MAETSADEPSRATARAQAWLSNLEGALGPRGTGDFSEAVVVLFGENCFWRDLIAFTWNIVTVEGRPSIQDMLEACLGGEASNNRPFNMRVDGQVSKEAEDGLIEAAFIFETAVCRGRGRFRLRGDGLCWTLLTTMDELKGFEEKAGSRRVAYAGPAGVGDHGGYVAGGCQSWQEALDDERAQLGHSVDPFCVIVGGGQV
jgi:putative flavoprotein involved in K+ transport